MPKLGQSHRGVLSPACRWCRLSHMVFLMEVRRESLARDFGGATVGWMYGRMEIGGCWGSVRRGMEGLMALLGISPKGDIDV